MFDDVYLCQTKMHQSEKLYHIIPTHKESSQEFLEKLARHICRKQDLKFFSENQVVFRVTSVTTTSDSYCGKTN